MAVRKGQISTIGYLSPDCEQEWQLFAEDTAKHIPVLLKHISSSWGSGYGFKPWSNSDVEDDYFGNDPDYMNSSINDQSKPSPTSTQSGRAANYLDDNLDMSSHNLTCQTIHPLSVTVTIKQPPTMRGARLILNLVWRNLHVDDNLKTVDHIKGPLSTKLYRLHSSPTRSGSVASTHRYRSIEVSISKTQIGIINHLDSTIKVCETEVLTIYNHLNTAIIVKPSCDNSAIFESSDFLSPSQSLTNGIGNSIQNVDILVLPFSYVNVKFVMNTIDNHYNLYFFTLELRLLKVYESTTDIAGHDNSNNQNYTRNCSLTEQQPYEVKVYSCIKNPNLLESTKEITFDVVIKNWKCIRIFSVHNTSNSTLKVNLSTLLSDSSAVEFTFYHICHHSVTTHDDWSNFSSGYDTSREPSIYSIKKPVSAVSTPADSAGHGRLGNNHSRVSFAMVNYFPLVCTPGFPFSLIQNEYLYLSDRQIESVVFSSLQLQQDTPRDTVLDLKVKSSNEIVKYIKQVYKSVNEEFLNGSCLHRINEQCDISIDPFHTASIAVVCAPTNSSIIESDFSRYLKISVHDSVTTSVTYLKMNGVVRKSEFSILQKNLNFGRIIIGESTTRYVTIKNESDVPCLYSISKTGSIASEYIRIPSGRRGWIPPKSSLNLDFIFTPKMPGAFEEILKIENVFDTSNNQSIVVKAKIAKPDRFKLSPHPQDDYSKEVIERCTLCQIGQKLAKSVDDSQPILYNEHRVRDTTLNSPSTNSASDTSVSNVQADIASSLKTFFIGELMLGETSCAIISFRLKNVTSKIRQFIVDAAHIDALSLLPPMKTSAGAVDFNFQSIFSSSDSSCWSWKLSKSDESYYTSNHPVPFEAIPETLQSILGMHCRFEMLPVEISRNTVSEEDRKKLEDKRERYLQKIKIASRKNRPEKLTKYEKKIEEIDEILNGSAEVKLGNDLPPQLGPLIDPGFPSVKDQEGDDDEKEHGDILSPLKRVSVANRSVATEPGPPSSETPNPRIVGASDTAIHIRVHPEQTVVLKIKVTLLPSSSYQSWLGLLPFRGFFRVYECRNEDSVEMVRFLALVASPSRKISLSHSLSYHDLESAVQKNDNLRLNESFEDSKDEMGIFLITVSQSSSYATRHLYPDYRFARWNTLGMSVKMTQASRERVLYASFTLSSFVKSTASLKIFLIDDDIYFGNPAEKHATRIKSYQPVEHGTIGFAVVKRVRSNSISNFDTPSVPSIPPAFDPTGTEATNTNFDMNASRGIAGGFGGIIQEYVPRLKPSSHLDKDLEFSLNSISCQISPRGVIQCTLRWQPPDGLPKGELLTSAIGVSMEFQAEDEGVEVTATHSQIIPLVCLMENSSKFLLDKFIDFGDVPLGTTRLKSVKVTNLSSSGEFHYLIVPYSGMFADESAVGVINVVAGQHLTGVLPPSESKTILLQFAATSLGKFEHEIWVSDLNDHFDQKRCFASAVVSFPTFQFVTFPDLQTDDDGKYKSIDLGLIQLLNRDAAIDNIYLPLEEIESRCDECKYQLRVRNVSSKALVLTAASNLKRQCYIFIDERCCNLISNLLVPAKTESILYIVIRPSSTYNRQPYESTTVSGNGPVSSAAPSPTKYNLVQSTYDAQVNEMKINVGSQLKGRELLGGIRLVIYQLQYAADDVGEGSDQNEVDVELSESDLATTSPIVVEYDPSTLKKLFETTIPFKATVGISVLDVRPPRLQLDATTLRTPINLSHVIKDTNSPPPFFFSGEFTLENLSPTFPMKYRYVSFSSIVHSSAESDDFAPDKMLSIMSERNLDFIIVIFDSKERSLAPGQSKLVKCMAFSDQKSSHLNIQDISIINLNTHDLKTIQVLTYCNFDQLENEIEDLEKSDHNSFASKSSARVYFSFPIRLKLVNLNSPLKITDIKPTVKYQVIGSGAYVLCQWNVKSRSDTSLMVTPVSNLPIHVRILHKQEKSATTRALNADDCKIQKYSSSDRLKIDKSSRSRTEYPSLLALPENGSLKKCGKAVSIPPHEVMTIQVLVETKDDLTEKKLKELIVANTNENKPFRTLLEDGNFVKLEGLIGLATSAHALKSFFDPSAVVTKTSIGASAILNAAQPSLDDNQNSIISIALTTSRSSRTPTLQHTPIPNCGVSIPMEYYTNVQCSVVCPRVTIFVKPINLGTIQSDITRTVELATVFNMCEDVISIQISNVPCWLVIQDVEQDAITHPSSLYSNKDKHFQHSSETVSPLDSGSESELTDLHHYIEHHKQARSRTVSDDVLCIQDKTRVETIVLKSWEQRIVTAVILTDQLVPSSTSFINSELALIQNSSRIASFKHTVSIKTLDIPSKFDRIAGTDPPQHSQRGAGTDLCRYDVTVRFDLSLFSSLPTRGQEK